MKIKIVSLMMILLLIISACGQKAAEIEETGSEAVTSSGKASTTELVGEDVSEEQQDTETAEEDSQETSSEDSNEEVEEDAPLYEDETALVELEQLKSSGATLEEAYILMTGYVEKVSPEVAGELLAFYLEVAENSMYDDAGRLFDPSISDIHMHIYNVYEANRDKLTYGYVYLGDEKLTLLEVMDDETYVNVLEELYAKGYGLFSAEGAFYPVVDYQILMEQYSSRFSEESMTLLEILMDSTIEPTTVEEYLSVSPQVLRDRAIETERYLMDYPEAPAVYKELIKRQLQTCLWKLSSPSIFDGMLDENFKVSESLATVYDEIVTGGETPVVTEVVLSITTWIEQDEDGVLDEMDAIFGVASDIFGQAMEKLNTLYP